MVELNNYLDNIRIPTHDDKVYKDESVYDFDTPESENGLYICLKTFYGVSSNFLDFHHQQTQSRVYLHIKRTRIEIEDDQNDVHEKPTKITKLAIGVEGGFNPDKLNHKFVEEFKVIVYPELTCFELADADLPETIRTSVASVIASESAFRKEEIQAASGTWDGEKLVVSKHAHNLIQLDNGVKIPPKGWKCTNCDKRDNLWLNLTDGTVLCGRRNYDGSGGNNHALEYYEKTKYPLAVKLGTITSEGADVYSYEELDMVEDPLLEKHLSHFGININQMEKTEKTMIELEIDANKKFDEWLTIQESNSNLTSLYGAGYVGLDNLGNSCYLNSVMQVLFAMPEFKNTYFEMFKQIYTRTSNPFDDFDFQMAKLAYGLHSTHYSIKPKDDQPVEQRGIKPTSFKSLVGKNHAEFSTKRQQDAQEFFLHIMALIEKSSKKNNSLPNQADIFKFKIEDRLQCTASNRVSYTDREEFVLSLPIPLDKATNLPEVAAYECAKNEAQLNNCKLPEVVKPRVNLIDCLNQYASEEVIDDFISPATKTRTQAKKLCRMKTYPDYLMLHMQKYTLDDSWQPKKIECSLDVPPQIDLAFLRAHGLQAHEELLPEIEDSARSVEQETVFDEQIVNLLVEMGYPVDACKRALLRTKSNSAELALNWLFAHQDDSDFDAPIEQETRKKSNDKKPKFVPSSSGIEMLTAMGISQAHAVRGLKETNNNVEAAIDWIFSNSEKLSQPEVAEVEDCDEKSESVFRDGNEKYQLIAFISHMGSSTLSGHYVCHIMKDGKWVIHNDQKVALSERPPIDLAYMYLYKRI